MFLNPLDLKKEKDANFNSPNEAVEAQKSLSGPNEAAGYKVLFFHDLFYFTEYLHLNNLLFFLLFKCLKNITLGLSI